MRVLLIEDNPGDARLIREMLRDAQTASAPIRLAMADRLADGIDKLGEGDFDAILLDLSLPDAHGLDTFRRAHAAAGETPIVVLSGLDDETVAMEAVQGGAQDYLIKGNVDGNLLLRSMRYAIERRRAQQALQDALRGERTARETAERLAAERAAILGQIADGVVITDRAGEITFVNAAARRLYGASPDAPDVAPDFVNARVSSLDGEPLARADRPLARAVATSEPVRDAEWIVTRPDDTQVVLQGSAALVAGEDGTRLGTVLTMRDVTARHELERQKDQFFASISHDLRTPLAAIKASVGVVLANMPPGIPEPLSRLLTNIDLAADEMSRMVADLLELTRLQAGRVQLRLSETNLTERARRAAQAVEPLALERGQRIELALPEAPVCVTADADRLDRVLVNLVSNAQKYGRPGGFIRICLEPRDDEVRISVADDGPGIPEAEQARIFERFYRAESEIAAGTPGSGLGLPIARGFVELHGGEIGVESRPGDGATFWVTLPRAPQGQARQTRIAEGSSR